MTRGPELKSPRPSWSTVLRARRISLDLKQEDVSARTNDLISQGTVSDLERGKVALANLTGPRMAALAAALDWSIDDMEEATGVPLGLNLSTMLTGTVVPSDDINSTPFDPRTLFHPPAQRERIKRDLSPNLSQMIAEKQEKYPQLQETRWQQHLNQTRFANGQEPDADGWFEMYQALRRNNVEPEPWPDD